MTYREMLNLGVESPGSKIAILFDAAVGALRI
jgi:hypothetical protein